MSKTARYVHRDAQLIRNRLNGTNDGVSFGPDFYVGDLILPVVLAVTVSQGSESVFEIVENGRSLSRTRTIHNPRKRDLPTFSRIGHHAAEFLIIGDAILEGLNTD
jgi:hypothetical protein